MARRFLRQRLGSPAMLVALAILALLTAAQATEDPERALGSGFLALALIAAGSVARDISGGAIQMILARPIRRTSYLFGRYAGVLATYAAFLLVAAAVAVAFRTLLRSAMHAPPIDPQLPALARGIAAGLANALLFSAILLFFSTFLRGYADVLAYFVLLGTLGLLPNLGRQLGKPGLERAGEALRDNVLPQVDWSAVLRGQRVLAEPTGRFALAVAVFLAFAVLVFSRREFSYGQD